MGGGGGIYVFHSGQLGRHSAHDEARGVGDLASRHVDEGLLHGDKLLLHEKAFSSEGSSRPVLAFMIGSDISYHPLEDGRVFL